MKQLNDSLTKEQEMELGAKIQIMKELRERKEAGYDSFTDEENRQYLEGELALEQLVGNYFNLARKIAHQHHKRTGTRYDIEDLLQDAIGALCESAYNYDPSQNCKLGTYAYYGITKRVSTTINYQRLVRMPENKMGEYVQITKAQQEYNDLSEDEQKKFSSELEYIYKNVDLDQTEINLILENMQPQVSLNAAINEGNGELMDLIEDETSPAEELQIQDLDTSLKKILAKMTQYERDLIAYEFGAFPASMAYSDFLVHHDKTDRQVTMATHRALKKMQKLAEEVGA